MTELCWKKKKRRRSSSCENKVPRLNCDEYSVHLSAPSGSARKSDGEGAERQRHLAIQEGAMDHIGREISCLKWKKESEMRIPT